MLTDMVKHHQRTIKTASHEVTGGKNPAAIALAKSIVSSQQVEIVMINGLLVTL